jgi:hypothetical protein
MNGLPIGDQNMAGNEQSRWFYVATLMEEVSKFSWGISGGV